MCLTYLFLITHALMGTFQPHPVSKDRKSKKYNNNQLNFKCMEKKNFLRFLLAIAAVIFTAVGCSDHSMYEGGTPTPNPDPDPTPDGSTVTLVEGSRGISHDWKYANLLVSDVVTSKAVLEHDNGETIKEEQINQLLPFEIKWTQPAEMTRGSKVFALQEKNFGQAIQTATENNDNSSSGELILPGLEDESNNISNSKVVNNSSNNDGVNLFNLGNQTPSSNINSMPNLNQNMYNQSNYAPTSRELEPKKEYEPRDNTNLKSLLSMSNKLVAFVGT